MLPFAAPPNANRPVVPTLDLQVETWFLMTLSNGDAKAQRVRRRRRDLCMTEVSDG